MFKHILFGTIIVLASIGFSSLDVWGHEVDGSSRSHRHKKITTDGGKTWREHIVTGEDGIIPSDGEYGHTTEIDETVGCWTLPYPADGNREYQLSDSDIDPYTGKTCGEIRKGKTGLDDQTSQNPIPTPTVASDDQTSQNPIPTPTVAVETPDSGPVVTPGIIPPASQPQLDPIPQVQPPIESEDPKIEVIVAPSRELIISEMMLRNYIRRGKNLSHFEPHSQWIEITNLSKTEKANLNGWRLRIRNGGDTVNAEHRTIDVRLGETKIIEPGESILIVQQSGRAQGFDNLDVFNLLNTLSYSRRINVRRNNKIFSETHLNIRLIDPDKEVVDEVGNIEHSIYSPEDPVALWEMPQSEDGSQRSSLIRRYKYKGGDEPIKGTSKGAWVLADSVITRFSDKLSSEPKWYGHYKDIGTPGYVIEGRLPVELSHFSPKLIDDTIVISWTTESEVNNAGFNILRGTSENGKFVKINPILIQGNGTTSERNEYQWKDTTAHPNTTYYYRIEDVSFDGDIQTLKQSHLKGFVSPQSKMITTWGSLKR